MSCDIAVIGLGVMGRNIALNMADQGHKVAVYNRSQGKVDLMMEQVTDNQTVVALEDIRELQLQLQAPRKVLLMLTAGAAVDAVIENLLQALEPGDIIIDGGNSNFHDTQRRWESLKQKGMLFVGAGISGGEDGARYGPSIMPGGDKAAWPLIKPLLQSIAAKTDDGEVCCQWVGEGGAGHYVKMIHNGIEYGDMQLIVESWQLMQVIGFNEQQIADAFRNWNEGVLQSYLIEITADILQQKDDDGVLRVHRILDSAGQKGTGRWTAIDSLELGAPLTLISEAVYARVLSAYKDERVKAAKKLAVTREAFTGELDSVLANTQDALYASKIISYTQGFMQMRLAAKEYGWNLEYGNIALLWRAGCIIRSLFLTDIKQAFESNPDLESLMMDDFFAEALQRSEQGWRAICSLGIQQVVPMPAMNAALIFYDGYRTETLPANLLQAQRDYFGAHTYHRIDKPDNESFHTRWTGDGIEEKV
ncbi:MAG: decarboxylating NADP(+)-dependent phosphogluconate dehydrogenase [Gammaproteobacteria bacterium]|nr:decarboxylating NADP(+)-dependent phosphogluconate dehydrogenase [Gammaproteobacteria bacterium]